MHCLRLLSAAEVHIEARKPPIATLLLPLSSCSHAGDARRPTAPGSPGGPPVRTDASGRRQTDFVRGGVETGLVVDRRQDLVDVCLEYHATHNYLVEDVVNLQ